jgi:hypothetical protein
VSASLLGAVSKSSLPPTMLVGSGSGVCSTALPPLKICRRRFWFLEDQEMTARQFHLSDILTITDGRLISTRHIEGVYDILNFMTGESLFTHQLPRAMDSCRSALIAQHPHLTGLVDPETKLDAESLPAWLAKQVAKFGEELPVTPLAEWQHKDPIEELTEMAPGKVVQVVVPE